MENFDRVSKYAQIAAESEGTAAEKMKAYTDSIEASEQRIKVAIEQWALDLNISDFVKRFYDAGVYLVDNIEKVAGALALLIVASKGTDLLGSLGSGFITLTNKNLRVAQTTENALSEGGILNGIKGVFKNFVTDLEEETKALNKEKYDDVLSRRLGFTTEKTKLRAQGIKQDWLTLDQQKRQTILDNQLLSVKKDEIDSTLAQLKAQGKITDAEEEEYKKILESIQARDDLTQAQKEVAIQTGEEEAEENSQDMEELTNVSEVAKRFGGLAGTAIGGTAFATVSESLVGEGWGPLGSTIGGLIGNEAGVALGGAVTESLSKAIIQLVSSGSIISALKTLGTTFVGALGAVGAVATVITGIVTVSAHIISDRKEKLEQLKEEFKEMEEEYQGALKVTPDVAEYDKLVEGVDSFGRNVSLTNEEYSRFLEISSELAETFPELETRTNSAGDTFVTNAGKVGKMTETVDKLIESMKEERDLALLNSKSSFGTDVSLLESDLADLRDARKELEKQDKEEEKLKEKYLKDRGAQYNQVQIGQDEYGNPITGYALDSSKAINKLKTDLEKYKQLLKDSQEELQGQLDLGEKGNNQIKEDMKEEIAEYSGKIDELQGTLSQWYNGDIETQAENYAKQQNRSNRNQAEEDYENKREALTLYADAVINTSPLLKAKYAEMDEEIQGLVQSLNKEIDLTDIQTDEQFKKVIKKNITEVEKLMEENPELTQQIKLFYDLTPEMNAADYAKERDKLLQSILNLGIEDEEIVKRILTHLEFVLVDENGNIMDAKNWLDQTDKLDMIIREGLGERIIGSPDELTLRKYFSVYSVEGMVQAYDILQKRVDGIKISFSDLNKEIAKQRFDTLDAKNLYDTYEKIKDETSDISKEQTKMIEDELKRWGKELGIIETDYKKINEVIQNTQGNLTPWGTIEGMDLNDVESQLEKYEKIKEHLQSDEFKTYGWDFSILQDVLDDDRLKELYATPDKLIAKIKELEGVANETAQNIAQEYIANTEAGWSAMLGNSEAIVEELKKNYNINLRDYKTLEEAKVGITETITNNVLIGWEQWRDEQRKIYQDDLKSFMELQLAKSKMDTASKKALSENYAVNKSLERVGEQLGYTADDLKWKKEEIYQRDKMNGGGLTRSGADSVLLNELTKEMQEKMGADSASIQATVDKIYNDYLTNVVNSVGSVKLNTTGQKVDSSKSSSSDSLPDEKYKASDYLESLESLINKEWEAMEVFDELTGKPKVIDVLVDDYNVKDFFDTYTSELNKAKELGVDLTNTLYGNIDTGNRQVLQWTEENLNKYKWQLSTWGESAEDFKDTISTVFGGVGEYGKDKVKIAFSPILQSDEGPVLLSSTALDKYLNDIIDKAGKDVSKENLLKLDAEGLDEFGLHFKNLIADIGETAEKTSESMHFTGPDGALNSSYKDLQKAAELAGISVEQLNEAIANNNIESVLGSKEVELETKYFDKMRESINKRLEQLKKDIEQSEKDYETLQAKADEYDGAQTKEAIEARNEAGDAFKEWIDLRKQEIELQVQLNNLDDEEVEDRITIAEAQDASLQTLIRLNQELLWTSDTEEERVQRNKTILDLLKQQYEAAKRVREFYSNFVDRTRNVYSGTAWSNSSDYDSMQQYQFAYNEKNAEAILNERDRLFSIKYDQLMSEGIYSEEQARKLAMEDEEVLSLTEEYIDTIDKRSEIIIQGIDDKVSELSKQLDYIEKGRPKEWASIGQLQNSYNQETAILIEQLNILNQGLAQAAYLTDEQIQNLVDQINDINVKLHENQITVAEEIKNKQEEQFEAIKSKVEEYKDAIQDQIDALEEAYQNEVKPLQEANDERERALTLEEKLLAIKRKEQERERVYRQGKRKFINIDICQMPCLKVG